MKLFIKKYCSYKTITVVLLLLSFNVASFGQDIHNCLCKPQKVEKKSCCSKEVNCPKDEVKEADDCCSDAQGGLCNNCKTCSFEKTVEKEQGTIIESKLPKPDAKVIIQESLSSTFNKYTNLNSYRSDNSPGIRSKVFLDISSLRI